MMDASHIACTEQWMQVSRNIGSAGEGMEQARMPWAQAAHGMPALLRCTDPLGFCGFVNQAAAAGKRPSTRRTCRPAGVRWTTP